MTTMHAKPLAALARACAITAALMCSCSVPVDSTTTDPYIDYSSKTVEYSAYVDPNYLVPVETRVYDQYGEITSVYRHTYEPVASDPGYWVLARTDLYGFSASGDEYLSGYFKFTYTKDSFIEFGVTEPIVDYVLLQGESFKPDGTRWQYYDVIYQDMTNQPDRYLSIRDWQYDDVTKAFVEMSQQTSTYAVVCPATASSYDVYDYVTEKYFARSSFSSPLALTQEFASWYDSDGNYTHELFHTARGDTSATDKTFFTKYDRNEQGLVCSQQDFDYVLDISQKIGDGSFNAATIGTYSLLFASIGDLVETLYKSFDDLGNVVLRRRTTNGVENERIVYQYDGTNQTSMARYVQGKSYVYNRTETRYYDQYRDGVYYRVKEELAYQPSDSVPALSSVASRTRFGSSSANSITDAFYRPLRSNHDR